MYFAGAINVADYLVASVESTPVSFICLYKFDRLIGRVVREFWQRSVDCRWQTLGQTLPLSGAMVQGTAPFAAKRTIWHRIPRTRPKRLAARSCLELVAEDLAGGNCYRGRCLHCRQEISALGGVAWSHIVRNPCPHCGRAGWWPETGVSTRRNQTSRAIDRRPDRRPIIG